MLYENFVTAAVPNHKPWMMGNHTTYDPTPPHKVTPWFALFPDSAKSYMIYMLAGWRLREVLWFWRLPYRLTHSPKCIHVLSIAWVNPGALDRTRVNRGAPLHSGAMHPSCTGHLGAPKCTGVFAAHSGSTMHTPAHTGVTPEQAQVGEMV